MASRQSPTMSAEPMRPSVRELYLGLLVKSVANLIYGPHPPDPWTDGLFGGRAGPGRDRTSPAHTMIGILRLENIRDLAQRAIDQGVAGDFIETGVWRGGCCILMRGILAANGIADRKIYVADSFAGLPAPDPERFPQDQGLTLHMVPELAVSLDAVKANYQVVVVEGSSVKRCLASMPDRSL
jgi:O-methyltransferase